MNLSPGSEQSVGSKGRIRILPKPVEGGSRNSERQGSARSPLPLTVWHFTVGNRVQASRI